MLLSKKLLVKKEHVYILHIVLNIFKFGQYRRLKTTVREVTKIKTVIQNHTLSAKTIICFYELINLRNNQTNRSGAESIQLINK